MYMDDTNPHLWTHNLKWTSIVSVPSPYCWPSLMEVCEWPLQVVHIKFKAHTVTNRPHKLLTDFYFSHLFSITNLQFSIMLTTCSCGHCREIKQMRTEHQLARTITAGSKVLQIVSGSYGSGEGGLASENIWCPLCLSGNWQSITQ